MENRGRREKGIGRTREQDKGSEREENDVRDSAREEDGKVRRGERGGTKGESKTGRVQHFRMSLGRYHIG